MTKHSRTPGAAPRGRRARIRRARGSGMWALWLAIVSSAWVLGAGCGGRNEAGSGESGHGAGEAARQTPATGEEASMSDGSEGGATGSDDASLRASVELALMAHHVRPDESLAVRLMGTVGPDGSWALDKVDVRREGNRIVLDPRVRRVEGDMFIQMVIPLDHTMKLALGAGTHRIQVLRRGAALVDTVVVSPDAQRALPVVELGPLPTLFEMGPGRVGIVPVPFDVRVTDGWIDRVEWREVAAGRPGPWRAPEVVERPLPWEARGTLTVRRPAGDPVRRVEVRAFDGQGDVSHVTTIELPAL
jgi:hypothetical protein